MLKIRLATKNDATAMLKAHRDAVFSKAAGHYDQDRLEEWSPGATPDRITQIEQETSDPNLIVLVAETNQEVIGFSLVNLAKSELGAVYVRPNSVGNVGRALLSEIEKQAFGRGIEELTCDASLNAESFYNANGYISEGHFDHVLRTGGTVPCIRMKKLRPQRLER